ncbi:hypothetical protein BCE_0679 [Bacillus cereus ATCC 10987]|uniref:Uncharacterized protein n=1 Tax=Bacillus cereus (strain ATCC 10987 / NRS 248) TaxID=222523 RepID=Q73DN3_BACC1|nr:hypothetical protein BCE_0679 [Bacillus cereus ATCC 10987]
MILAHKVPLIFVFIFFLFIYISVLIFPVTT